MQGVDPTEFRRDPRGRYLSGHSFVLWVYDERLVGSMYFGQPDARDFPTLLAMVDMPLHPSLEAPWDALVDCSELAGLDAAAFEILARHLGEVRALAGRVRRVALVRPPGMTGAAVAGLFYEAVRTTFPAALFSDRAEALGWLARPDGARVAAALEAIAVEASRVPPLLRALRRALAEKPRGSTIGGMAKILAMSPRSLQRQLGALGTSFRGEMERARVRTAEALLAGSDAKLAAVAVAAGFSSPAHFSSTFRRITGETPSRFRERRKKSPSTSDLVSG